jgi:hypothetical protein
MRLDLKPDDIVEIIITAINQKLVNKEWLANQILSIRLSPEQRLQIILNVINTKTINNEDWFSTHILRPDFSPENRTKIITKYENVNQEPLSTYGTNQDI